MTDSSSDSNSQGETVEAAARAFEHLLFPAKSEKEQKTPDATQDEQAKSAPATETDSATADDASAKPEETDTETTAEQDEETTKPAPKTRKIKVDGKEEEVTEDELEKGYSRTADYTRKTQAHAEAVKKFETERDAERTQLATARQEYAENLRIVKDTLTRMVPQEPDWEQLRRTAKPEDYNAIRARWDEHKDRVAKVEAEEKRVAALVKTDNDTKFQKYLTGEREKLVAALPEWKEPKVALEGMQQLSEFAQANGYSPKELEDVYDHRIVLLLRKAMLYDQQQAKMVPVREKIEQAKTLLPGSTNSSSKKTEQQKRMQRLKESGSTDDAAAALMNMI